MGQSNQKADYLGLKNKLITVFGLIFFWLLVGFYQYADRYTVLDAEGCLDEHYSVWPYIQGIFISIFVGGTITSVVLVFVWEKWLRNMSFAKAISYIILCYVSLYIFLTFLAISYAQTNPEIIPSENLNKSTLEQIFNVNLLPNFLFWLAVMLLSILFLLVRDKFGPGVFLSFLAGKYFRPRREERIFLFMDLKSSTTIAEELGEETYFEFLNETFKTATPGILATRGEIYQYVGDEIVISWKLKDGLQKANCLLCFYEIKKLLQDNASMFSGKYGHIPQFKAGLHFGFVVAGEIGIIKREIVYSGDVLNTTARLQSMCNSMKVEILASRKLIDLINPILLPAEVVNQGELLLKGKLEKVEAVTFQV